MVRETKKWPSGWPVQAPQSPQPAVRRTPGIFSLSVLGLSLLALEAAGVTWPPGWLMASRALAQGTSAAPGRIAQASAGTRTYTPATEKGLYTIQIGSESEAFLLPPPGDANNDCQSGDVIGLNFSPDGRYLVAQVAGKDSATLCLYTIRDLLNKKQVRVERLGSGGGAGASAGGSGSNLLLNRRRAERDFQELEPDWKPVTVSQEGGRETSGVVFSRSEKNRGDRLFSLPASNGRVQVSGIYAVVDGGPANEAPSWFATEGHWTPVSIGPAVTAGATTTGAGKATFGLAFVTNQGLSVETGAPAGAAACGKARIAYRSEPEKVPSSTRYLTTPCNDPTRGKDTNVSDSYLDFDPSSITGARGRLGFVRTVLGRSSRICVVEDVLVDTTPRERCYEAATPEQTACSRFGLAFSDDGRWILNYCSLPGTAKKPASLLVEGLNLASDKPQVRVLVRDVKGLDLIGMGPTLLPGGGTTLVTVPEKGALRGELNLWSLPPDTGAVPEVVQTGLINLKAVAATRVGANARPLLALVAQTGARSGDADKDKVYLMLRPASKP